MIDLKDKTDFIYKAIDDTANTIKFIDAKVASIFIVIGIITTVFISLSDKILVVYNHFRNFTIHNNFICFSILFYFISVTISSIYGFKTLRAIENPCNSIKQSEENNRKDLWYLLNSSDNKISIGVNEYLVEINNLEEDYLIKMISIELMKLSAIRNYKIKNINKALNWFQVSFLSIFILIIYILIYYSI